MKYLFFFVLVACNNTTDVLSKQLDTLEAQWLANDRAMSPLLDSTSKEEFRNDSSLNTRIDSMMEQQSFLKLQIEETKKLMKLDK